MEKVHPKEARETLGLSQTQMAKMMRVHRNLWLKWERKEQRCTAAPTTLIWVFLWLQKYFPAILKKLFANLEKQK